MGHQDSDRLDDQLKIDQMGEQRPNDQQMIGKQQQDQLKINDRMKEEMSD